MHFPPSLPTGAWFHPLEPYRPTSRRRHSSRRAGLSPQTGDTQRAGSQHRHVLRIEQNIVCPWRLPCSFTANLKGCKATNIRPPAVDWYDLQCLEHAQQLRSQWRWIRAQQKQPCHLHHHCELHEVPQTLDESRFETFSFGNK